KGGPGRLAGQGQAGGVRLEHPQIHAPRGGQAGLQADPQRAGQRHRSVQGASRRRRALRQGDLCGSGTDDAKIHAAGNGASDADQQKVEPRTRGAGGARAEALAERQRGNMGQKVHPVGFRLGIIKTWDSKWYEEKNYAQWLHEDIRIRDFVKKSLGHAGVSKVEIERAANKVKVNVHTARPGIVIGKRGAGIETIKKDLQQFTKNEVFLNIVEVRKAETDAQLVAENIATQLERRIAFRRAMEHSIQTAMKFGAKGIRVACSGRLGGSEMARYEWYREGRVPLHTLRADIDYGFAEAKTTYGKIGCKVWVCRGEVLPTKG